jgi:molybdopterin converting factor small subunit
MRRVKVLYFAGVKDLVGISEEWYEGETLTVSDLLTEIEGKHSEIQGLIAELRTGRSSTVLAIDQVFTREITAAVLKNGSEIAFIAPISGG